MHEQREVKALTAAFIFEDSSTDSRVRTILNMNGIVSEKKNVTPSKKAHSQHTNSLYWPINFHILVVV